MIKFKEFLTEGTDPFHNRAIGLMSGERGDLSPEINAHRSTMLYGDLKSRGHKVVPVKGGFIENHKTPNAKEVQEKSFLVMHHKHGDDKGAVKNTMIEMGKKYGQDSILHKPHNSDIASLYGTNKSNYPGLDKSVQVGRKRNYKGGPFFTEMPNGKRFTFESLNEDLSGQSLSDGGKKMLQYSHEYTTIAGIGHVTPQMQTSSAEKQKPIAHAFHQLANDNPDYKQHVFKAYQEQHPDMVRSSGAHDYDSLAHAAYHAFGNETSKQYDTLSKHIKFDYHGGDKNYANSDAMRHDLHNNNHMDVFNGGEPHEHPALSNRGSDGLNGNEKFRAVHDAFGHGILKNGFGPKGEETAWHIHSQTFSPLAKAAMTTETRGQNSWVNYSGVNTGKNPKDTTYAKQKVGLLPPEMNRPDYNGEVPSYMKKHMNTPITESNYLRLKVRESKNYPMKNLRDIVPLQEISDNARAAIKRMADDPRTHPNVRAIAQGHMNTFNKDNELSSRTQGWGDSRQPKKSPTDNHPQGFYAYNGKRGTYHGPDDRYEYEGHTKDGEVRTVIKNHAGWRENSHRHVHGLYHDYDDTARHI